MKQITKEMIFQGTYLEFKESTLKEIQVLQAGEWDHEFYGKIVIDKRVLAEFKKNFDKKLRKGIPINAGHDTGRETEAIGWMKKLTIKSGGLWATVEWTSKGKELLDEKSFKYFSPEFYRVYEDPETHEVYTNVLVGGALTNKPYFKGLKAIVTSEPNNKFNFSEINYMNLKQILAKEPGKITDEEKKYLRTHMSELTGADIKKFADDIAEGQESDDDKGDNDGNNSGDNADGGDNGDSNDGDNSNDNDDNSGDNDGDNAGGDAGNGDENVSAAELKELRRKADLGETAFQEQRKEKIFSEVGKMIFSSDNDNGKFLPKQKDAVVNFMESLNNKQRKTFNEIISAMPKASAFAELGDEGDTKEKTAASEVEAKIKAKMKEDEEMGYSDALNEVFNENPELASKYESDRA